MTPELSDCAETGGQTYGLLLYALAESVRARRILEIGAGWGHSGSAFAESMKNRLPSTLISVDPNCGRMRKDCAAIIGGSGITWDFLTEPSAKTDIAGPFDLVYIDGDPRNAKADFDKFAPMVRPGGLLVMDGYGGQPGPTEAVDKLRATHPFVILQYHDVYSFAIHSAPRKPLMSGGYSAKCEVCNLAAVKPTWAAIDEWSDAHVIEMLHPVEVIVAPRKLKYRKGPRS